MATVTVEKLVCLFLSATLFSGCSVNSLSYDYSSSIECLEEPLSPQYGGGIILNPEFNNGLKGWSSFGNANVTIAASQTGNKFLIAHSRGQPYQSFSQKTYLHKDKLYTFSASVQVSKGTAIVTVVFRTSHGQFIHAGVVEARSGCWSLLKGGLILEESSPAEFYFEAKITIVDIWVDCVSLQPFTKDQWRSHQTRGIQQVRKRRIRFKAVDAAGNTLSNATVSLHQNRAGFPFGAAIAQTILTNPSYQNWFTSSGFTVTTFENEMKWYSTEQSEGCEDYSAAEAMLAFTKNYGIAVRGHNIFWDDPGCQMNWVKSLSKQQLKAAANRRINSIVSRYSGQVIAWDVVNENLHNNFLESELGGDASTVFYQDAHQLDPGAMLFLNDYNTLEKPFDGAAKPAKYLEKLKEVGASGTPLAIGLEGLFIKPNVAYMRAALDTLAAAKVPIWLTEVDVSSGPNQVQYLEEILRKEFSHPAIEGIVIWAAWHPEGCYVMCLTDINFNSLPTGDVVDNLLAEWKSGIVMGATDSDGFFEIELFHGDYEVTVGHPSANSLLVQSLKVDVDTNLSFSKTISTRLVSTLVRMLRGKTENKHSAMERRYNNKK